jgi:UDP-N-acetylglucosamine:LPS N-acetylglucosamine transferase
MEERYSQDKIKSNRRKKILLMGGGLGILPVDSSFFTELEKLPDTDITIITGRNQRLYKQLSETCRNIRILGFVDNVNEYMRQSDVIISKPGGVTTFEAIHAEVPIIALNPYLQQELYNSQYIQEMNIGTVVTGSGSECLTQIRRIIESGQLEDYRRNIQKIKNRLNEVNLEEILEDTIRLSSLIPNIIIMKKYSDIREDKNLNEKVSFNI